MKTDNWVSISAIRLTSGREADLVEVKIGGRWGGICDDGFSFNEANVVCRQLGFELGAEQVRKRFPAFLNLSVVLLAKLKL